MNGLVYQFLLGWKRCPHYISQGLRQQLHFYVHVFWSVELELDGSHQITEHLLYSAILYGVIDWNFVKLCQRTLVDAQQLGELLARRDSPSCLNSANFFSGSGQPTVRLDFRRSEVH